MELNAVKSVYTFRANNDKQQNRSITPAVDSQQASDVFISSEAKPAKNIFCKIKNIVNSPEAKHKINTVKITKLLLQNGSLTLKELPNYKDDIEEYAKQDYKKFEKKYNTILKHAKQERNYKGFIQLYQIGPALKFKKLEAEDIDAIYEIKNSRNVETSSNKLSFYYFVQTLKEYDNFDILPARNQKNLMTSNGYDMPTYNTLTLEEAKNISKYSPLMKFDYISDLRAANSKEEFIQKMDKRRRNIPCKAIITNNEYFTSSQDIEALKTALNNTDLTKYKTGFKLAYTRDEFINDFNKLTEDLSPEEQEKVFDHFQFKINTANDIIKYPNPDVSKEGFEREHELINKFMLENKIQLKREDKDLETELNKIIKAYPEFISVIGKIQHRGDSIDYHTMDDMKRILNDPQYNELQESEQKILTTATLFHDFGKIQGEVDEGHARKSAIAAKEIIKKTSFTNDEKERIYNLINHSHWLVDGSSNEDIAFVFRRPNDFKMAEIFEKADCNSAGFEYGPSSRQITEIKKNIEKINSNGVLLFPDKLPTEDKYYDRTANGIRYLDFRDPEMSVEKYGYPAGTKVKDLKFLCHSSSDDQDNFKALCDDSKEVCLSTSLLDYRHRFSTGYNGMGSYIMDASNANILFGGNDIANTGGHRGYEYAKNTCYLRTSTGYITDMEEVRPRISKQIKSDLGLSDEEYSELYTKLCNKENIEGPDELISSIEHIKQELVRPKSKEEASYTNEIVIYNPKILAEVTRMSPEQLEKCHYTDKIYVLA